MSPSTEPDTAVATGSASSAPAGLVSGHLDTGTTPVFSMSGPQGPPTVYVPTNPDPLQGSGDPWLSFNTGGGGRSDGSFLSSGTRLPDRPIDRPVSRPIRGTEHTSNWSYVCNAARFSGHQQVVQQEVQEEFL